MRILCDATVRHRTPRNLRIMRNLRISSDGYMQRMTTMAGVVPAAEFTRNFGRYRMQAQREPVAVSSHGQLTGYFVAPEEFEAFQRFRARSFATTELPDEVAASIGRSRMDTRHAALDALLDGE